MFNFCIQTFNLTFWGGSSLANMLDQAAMQHAIAVYSATGYRKAIVLTELVLTVCCVPTVYLLSDASISDISEIYQVDEFRELYGKGC